MTKWKEAAERRLMKAADARGENGFTLIEALVALAVTVAVLGAIGQLGFSTYAAARRAETRLLLDQTARKAYAALTSRRALADDPRGGQIDGLSWRLETAPFAFDPSGAPVHPSWTPQAERLVVTAPGGMRVFVDTVRLRPTGAAR